MDRCTWNTSRIGIDSTGINVYFVLCTTLYINVMFFFLQSTQKFIEWNKKEKFYTIYLELWVNEIEKKEI
jgi:hypothetical protein